MAWLNTYICENYVGPKKMVDDVANLKKSWMTGRTVDSAFREAIQRKERKQKGQEGM